jgi:hypothetical protein
MTGKAPRVLPLAVQKPAATPPAEIPVTDAEKSWKAGGFSTPDPPISRERADTRGPFTAIGISVAPEQQMLFLFRHGVRELRGAHDVARICAQDG